MKLATFRHRSRIGIGKVIGERLIDLSTVLPNQPSSMLELLKRIDQFRSAIEEVCDERYTIPLSEVDLLAPIPTPGKILAIGANYSDHVAEALAKGIKVPEGQIWFNKQNSCVTGPFDPVHMPTVTKMLDWEVELAVIIGKRCRNVPATKALDAVAGYAVLNDFTCRDWQMRTPTWTLSKSFDTHGPMGPWIVTADEIEDPQNLVMRLWVNGELRQEASTDKMIHSIREQIAHLTSVLTLEPGDVIATGTPAGVAFGMNKPVYLRVGDIVRAEIEKIGYIENRIISDPAVI